MFFFGVISFVILLVGLVSSLPLPFPQPDTAVSADFKNDPGYQSFINNLAEQVKFWGLVEKYVDDMANEKNNNNQFTPIAHAAQAPEDSPKAEEKESNSADFNGEATFYTPGLGACGDTHGEQDLIAAIGASQYDQEKGNGSSAVCGRCALVQGPNGGSVKVRVADRCVSCKPGDLDLSPAAFNKIANMDDGRVHINWSFTSC